MTPVQAAALPVILAGNDVRVQARTGSGKTAAFGLGLFDLNGKARWRSTAIWNNATATRRWCVLQMVVRAFWLFCAPEEAQRANILSEMLQLKLNWLNAPARQPLLPLAAEMATLWII